jgi:hypothetical protein
MCDSSADFVSLDIDPTVHAINGGRDDGGQLPAEPEIYR